MLKSTCAAAAACAITLACGCSPPATDNNTASPTVAVKVPSPPTSANPIAETPVPPQDQSLKPTHCWWRGSGPNIQLNPLTSEEVRRATANPSSLEDRARQAQAKEILVSVMLRLAADSSSVEEAIVVVTPPDPNRASSDAERLRDELNRASGPKPVVDPTSPRFYRSLQSAPIDAEGHFAMTGFILAVQQNPPDQPDSAFPSGAESEGNYGLRGRFEGKSLSGTFEYFLASRPIPARPPLKWTGAYLDLPDAEVDKKVEELLQRFSDPHKH